MWKPENDAERYFRKEELRNDIVKLKNHKDGESRIAPILEVRK